MSYDNIAVSIVCLGTILAVISGRIFAKVTDGLEGMDNTKSGPLTIGCAKFTLAVIAVWLGSECYGLAGGVVGLVLSVCPGYWLIGQFDRAYVRWFGKSEFAYSQSVSVYAGSMLLVVVSSAIVAIVLNAAVVLQFGLVPALLVATLGAVEVPFLATGVLVLVYTAFGGLSGGVIPQMIRLLVKALNRQEDRIVSMVRSRRLQ
jgi:hypothetical protein